MRTPTWVRLMTRGDGWEVLSAMPDSNEPMIITTLLDKERRLQPWELLSGPESQAFAMDLFSRFTSRCHSRLIATLIALLVVCPH